jgi:hypothetical protein
MKSRTTACALGAAIFLAATLPAQAAQPLKPGPIPGVTLVLDNARGSVWCELVPMVGTPPNLTAHIYTSTSVDHCDEKRAAAVDPVKLAADLGVPKVAVNPGRYWVMDKVTLFAAGETVALQGIKVKWGATMTPEDVTTILSGKPWGIGRIKRDTEWLYRKGKPVWLLHAPENKVWVLQVFTKAKDPSLSMETLDTLGGKLQLPPGWRFERKVLAEDLSLQPRRADGYAYIMRDNLGNTYQGCGYDAACSYLP